jgi:hypothetical protein
MNVAHQVKLFKRCDLGERRNRLVEKETKDASMRPSRNSAKQNGDRGRAILGSTSTHNTHTTHKDDKEGNHRVQSAGRDAQAAAAPGRGMQKSSSVTPPCSKTTFAGETAIQSYCGRRSFLMYNMAQLTSTFSPKSRELGREQKNWFFFFFFALISV